MACTQQSDPFQSPQDRCSEDNRQTHCGESNPSHFEKLICEHPPILESLLLQLPTAAFLRLYHVSKYLRSFLQSYPIAWSHLSFRLTTDEALAARGLAGGDRWPSKPYALDQLLLMVVTPFGTRLKTLDLDYTAVSGHVLTSLVLPQRRETLTHLSVRGCKNVSLKYHIVPYLTLLGLERRAGGVPCTSQKWKDSALKSIYIYRCRHQRRRPYTPQSLIRTDSDSDSTHQLVKLCHELGIWTDTAWCPTPSGRCFKRREYHSGRTPPGPTEVWVVFDRLWRCGNRIGDTEQNRLIPVQPDGRLWEQGELGYDGEALGTEEGHKSGDGKATPAHLRQSHRVFVEGIKCDGCGDSITERCEQCSIRMHCQGCRKTLCGSCAFDRPLPRKKRKSRHFLSGPSLLKASDRNTTDLWWAPGAYQSPNLMQEVSEDGETSDGGPDVALTDEQPPPKLRFQWCCQHATFHADGRIAFHVNSVNGPMVNRIRTAPLPKGQGWEDPEFVPSVAKTFPVCAYGDKDAPDYPSISGYNAMLQWLLRVSEELQASSCPRSLCQECYSSMGWQAACKACKKPICLEHDVPGLQMRICGFSSLLLERVDLRKAKRDEALSAEAPISPDHEPGHPTYPRPLDIGRKILGGLSDSERIQLIASLVVLPDDNDNDNPLHSNRDDTTSTAARSSTNQTDDRPGRPFKEEPPSSSQRPRSNIETKPAKVTPWQGCASFLCPRYRWTGDDRQRCTSVLKECSTCAVHVCPDCLTANPACDCSYCSTNYNCPNCYGKLGVGVCRKDTEELERMIKAREAQARKHSDEVAGQLGEFFAGLEMSGAGNEGGGEVAVL